MQGRYVFCYRNANRLNNTLKATFKYGNSILILKKIQMQKSVSNTASLARVLINFYPDFDSASCCTVFTKKTIAKTLHKFEEKI